jgi:hypothetical protein
VSRLSFFRILCIFNYPEVSLHHYLSKVGAMSTVHARLSMSLLCIGALFLLRCGEVLDVKDEFVPPLYTLDIVGFNPAGTPGYLEAHGFMPPSDCIAPVDNPMAALVWLGPGEGLPESEWTYGPVPMDTTYLQLNVRDIAWPMEFSVDLTTIPDPERLAKLKYSPGSKAGIATIMLFNDGNRNGHLDPYDGQTRFGPYDYQNRLSFPDSLTDTVYSAPVATLGSLQKDWIFATGTSTALVYASDSIACQWLNAEYSQQQIADRNLRFAFRYRHQEAGSAQTGPVNFFRDIRPGYTVVHPEFAEDVVLDTPVTSRTIFLPVIKKWMRYRVNATPYDAWKYRTFSTFEVWQDEPGHGALSVMVTDSRDDLFQYSLFNNFSSPDLERPVAVKPPAARTVYTSVTSMAPHSLDFFRVDAAGAVQTCAWDSLVNNGYWRGWWQISNGMAAPGGPIVALSRDELKLDCFVVRPDSVVVTAAWNRTANSWSPWWDIPGQKFSPQTRLSAIARNATTLDVFGIGSDGCVYHVPWDNYANGGRWQSWEKIGGATMKAGTAVEVVLTDSATMAIFAISDGGNVLACQGRQSSWSVWTDLGNPGQPLASITVVRRTPFCAHLLAVTEDGRIYCREGVLGSWDSWNTLGTDLKVAPGCKPVATVRDSSLIDVFVFDADYNLYAAAWQSGRDYPNSYRGWWPLGCNFTPATQIGCIGRTPHTLDVFVVSGNGNQVWSRHYADGANWDSWRPILP